MFISLILNIMWVCVTFLGLKNINVSDSNVITKVLDWTYNGYKKKQSHVNIPATSALAFAELYIVNRFNIKL